MSKSQDTNSSTVQKFGGHWSLIKADIVEKYLKFFNSALKDKPSRNKPFNRIYIDAFAGSGTFQYIETPTNGLFPLEENEYIHAGSAKRALRVVPPFDQIIFFEQNKATVLALEKLIEQSGHTGATVKHGDANQLLRELCRQTNWDTRRGVIFLDPFGMSVEWSTLQIIAATKALDVWLLFPLFGTVRNLPRDGDALDETKRAAITRILGTDDWFDVFYREANIEENLLGIPMPRQRTAEIDQIEDYVQKRLKTIFPYVESAKRLRASGNRSLFSLFFAVSNPSSTAIDLARKVARHILNSG